MLEINDLNKKQKEAVQHTNGPLRILAGAGSGKTKVLTYKIAYLINEIRLEPWEILAVTFTNKAAKEMKKRVAKLIGDEKANKCLVSTYHSICVKILRQDIDLLGINKNFNIIDNIDQKQVLKSAYAKYSVSSTTMPLSQMIKYISKLKLDPNLKKELYVETDNEVEKYKYLIYLEYLQHTKNSNSLDFDDLLLKVYELFTKHEKILNKWKNKFKYILVDEFQDTSWVQYEIVKALSSNNNITIVGDPDQTIYTWRGAKVELIVNFDKDFKNTKTIKLEENYRSTKNIIKSANKLIKNNKNRLDKELFTNAEDGDKIKFHHAYSPEAEGLWVAKQIEKIKKQKVQLKDIAIFYRYNYLSRVIEQVLIEKNIPYRIFGDVKFFERKEIKDSLAFLKVINNQDNIALQRIINVPARKLGKTSINNLNEFANENKLTLFKAITQHFDVLPITQTQKNEIGRLFNLFNKYIQALKNNSISLVLEKFLIEVGYTNSLKQIEDNRLENIKELITNIKNWEKKNKDKTLNDYLQEVALMSSQDDIDEFQAAITLMTIHTSKGLEFDNVFIIGLSEQIFPSHKHIENNNDALEEERRLAYVAITRAKKRLFTSDSKGYSNDHRFMKMPSRFISEMGISLSKLDKEFYVEGFFKKNYNEDSDVKINKGDKVKHSKFGFGIVKEIKGESAIISFDSYGNKSIVRNHKSIKKV